MRIDFDDKSHIECRKSDDKILIIVSARDQDNPRKKITNACELTIDEFKQLISDIS